MKKIMVAILILAFASIALAGEKKCDSVSGAEDLWNFNLKSEALACLDEVIQADPTNTKAHFLKGRMCLALDNYDCAHERFSASPVRAKHGGEIAELYKRIGDAWLNANDINKAEEFYRKAYWYKLSIGKEVAKELFTNGAQIGNDNFLYLAGRLDPSLNKAIGEYYSSQSKVAPRKEDQIDFLGKAASFDNTLEKEYIENREAWGRFHLEEGKKWAKVPGKEKVTDDHRQAARKYLGDAVVESELPEVFILSPQTEAYKFELKKNEKTPYWLWGKQGIRTNLHFFATNHNFEVHYMNGSITRRWANDKFPSEDNERFTIVATEDVIVLIEVTKK